MDYQLPGDYKVYLNAYSDVLSDVPTGFKAFYNTPRYRLNMGLSNSTLGKNKNYGFNIVYHWQDAFFSESIYGDKSINAYSTLDAQVSHTFQKNKSMMIKKSILMVVFYLCIAGPSCLAITVESEMKEVLPRRPLLSAKNANMISDKLHDVNGVQQVEACYESRVLIFSCDANQLSDELFFIKLIDELNLNTTVRKMFSQDIPVIRKNYKTLTLYPTETIH